MKDNMTLGERCDYLGLPRYVETNAKMGSEEKLSALRAADRKAGYEEGYDDGRGWPRGEASTVPCPTCVGWEAPFANRCATCGHWADGRITREKATALKIASALDRGNHPAAAYIVRTRNWEAASTKPETPGEYLHRTGGRDG